MDTLVPFAADGPKTRLSGALNDGERFEFARAMLFDVCTAIEEAGGSPTVLSTRSLDIDIPVVVDDRPLSTAVNDRLTPPIAIVVADLALATPEALSRLFGTDGDVVIAPGLGGGTNALVVRSPEFRVDYHGTSVADHRQIAESVGAETTMVDSFRLAVDVDEPADFAEVLLHADGRAAAWLEAVGFEVETSDGRATVARS